MITEFYASPLGNDSWSGQLPEPDAKGTDGPVATIGAALRAVRHSRNTDRFSRPATVWLREGRYPVTNTFTLHPDDSQITFAAYKNEKPVLDGGIKIEGWNEETLNGKTVWSCDASAIVARIGYFHELFVNDRRARRPRLPKKDYFWVESAPETPVDEYHCFAKWQKQRFVAKPNDLRAWKNLSDVEVVIPHWWIEERRNIASFDETTRLVNLSEPTCMILLDTLNKRYARYYVENVFESLTEPGEWYLDRGTGKVFYLPQPGESIATSSIYTAGCEQLIRLAGKAEEKRFIEGVSFVGLIIEHAEWKNVNKSVQAAYWVPGTIALEAARNCSIEECTIRHMGNWAIDVGHGCTNIRIVGNRITDIGGGGIKVNGSDFWGPLHNRTWGITIADNEIAAIGRVHHSATAVLLGHTGGDIVAHNHIHDMYYTGISVGWVWGYGPSVARNIRIEKNHIHHCGQGVLSDMGGIYLLGQQPGTTIRNNLIHDVQSVGYGGWGIYPDEGSSYLVIENNVIYNTSSQLFHLHFGIENSIRNNIWAFANEGLIAISRGTRSNYGNKGGHFDNFEATCFTFERNIVVTDGQPIFIGGMDDETGNIETNSFISDLNLFYDVKNKPLVSGNAGHMIRTEGMKRSFSWQQMVELGYEKHSIIADPKFRDLKKFDFTLASDSPALSMGFKPIDLSDVGPRKIGNR